MFKRVICLAIIGSNYSQSMPCMTLSNGFCTVLQLPEDEHLFLITFLNKDCF